MKAGITTGTNTGGAHQQYPIHRYIKFIRQAGIPQGSACSPVIGSFFVSKLDFTLPKGAVVLNYADDFLVMAKSAEKREKATITLKASLEALSVGNFELLEKSSGSIPSGFTFLGHWFDTELDGTLVVRVLEANANKILSDLAAASEEMTDFHAKVKTHPLGQLYVLDRLAALARRILGWLQSYSEADDISKYESEVREWFNAICTMVEIDPQLPWGMAANLRIDDAEIYSGGS